MPHPPQRVIALLVELSLLVVFAVAAQGGDLVPTTDLNLRACRGTTRDCRVLRTLGPGEPLTELERAGEWARVRVDANGDTGWINVRYARSTAGVSKASAANIFNLRLPSDITTSELHSALLPMSLQSFTNMLHVLSAIASLAFYIGLMVFIARQLRLDPKAVIGIGVVLALIAGFSGAWEPAYMVTVLVCGGVGTALGGAGFGASVRVRSAAGILTGVLSIALFLASFVSPGSVDVRLFICAFIFVDAIAGFIVFERWLSNSPEILHSTFGGPALVVSTLGGLLILPLILPSWLLIQPAIFGVAAVLGAAAASEAQPRWA